VFALLVLLSGGTVKLIDCNDAKNYYIYELLPDAFAWNNKNWQNYILKYVEVI
jgi:hypothetical protein